MNKQKKKQNKKLVSLKNKQNSNMFPFLNFLNSLLHISQYIQGDFEVGFIKVN